jgi:2'-phosphotransferase
MGQQRRGKPNGGGRDVTVSKALSLLLRHAAEKEGLKLDSQGYANVADVVRSYRSAALSLRVA